MRQDIKTRFKKGQHPNPKTEFRKGVHSTPQTEFKKGLVPWHKGKKGIYSKETLEKMRLRKLGKKLSKEHRLKLALSHTGAKHWNWMGGITKLPYSVDWTNTLKRSIRERDNYICQICSQYGCSVHHIDYDKKNSIPDNLITLCRSCHTKTNSDRKNWLDFFRKKNV